MGILFGSPVIPPWSAGTATASTVSESKLIDRDEMIVHQSGNRHPATKLCGECYIELREIIKARPKNFSIAPQAPEETVSKTRIVGPEE